MKDTASAIRSSGRSRSAGPRAVPQPILLWQLRGATDDLRGLAIETAFGDAFGLELDAELVLLHLQSSLGCPRRACGPHRSRNARARLASCWYTAKGKRS